MAESAIQRSSYYDADGRPRPFPKHTDLPESDGTFVKNFQEHPQSILLTDSITPLLQQRHPDGHYAIGQDCGMYWRETDPPEQGAVAPDWFYVPDVPPLLDGIVRRSFVVWHELSRPLIALEFASGDGREERDSTPLLVSSGGEKTKPGKFWVYEHVIGIPYYGIYQIKDGLLEVYHLRDLKYHKMTPNQHGRYPIDPLGVELGLWQGSYPQAGDEQQWLRWWDREGNLLLIGHEQAEREKQRAEQEKQRAEQAEQARREAIPKLLAMGLSAEQVAQALELPLVEIKNNQ